MHVLRKRTVRINELRGISQVIDYKRTFAFHDYLTRRNKNKNVAQVSISICWKFVDPLLRENIWNYLRYGLPD